MPETSKLVQNPFPLSGVLNLDKPPSLSSTGALNRIKRFLPRGTKIGHAGTLDPFATGVLLVLIGRATKLCESLMNQAKQYQATILLGSTTATDDPESPPIGWPASGSGIHPPSPEQAHHIVKRFVGQIIQQPPAYSALHVGGRRAYELARAGHAVSLPPRPVTVYAIEVIDYAWPELKLRVDCGRGTYIRALARDIGAALNVGGHLTQLRRTRVGEFAVESATELSQITAETLPRYVVTS